MADTGQQNTSNTSGLDLLSEALGESGLNLEEPLDLFDTTAPNTLSTFDDFDYLSVLNDLNSLTNTTTATPIVSQPVVQSGPLDLNLMQTDSLFSRPQPISTQQSLQVQSTLASQPSNVQVPVVPAQSTRRLQQILSQNVLNTNTQRQSFGNSSPRMIDLASTSSSVRSNQIQWGSSLSLSKTISNEQGKKELTKKEVLRLWSNEDITRSNKEDEVDSAESVDAEDDEEEEDLGYTDTYAEYMPSKLSFGRRHPDPVVETSSLASVCPPNIWYRLKLPQEVIDKGLLSALQLEAVVYSCQKHETLLPNGSRAGFLIGDGAGVGKGRIVAGIIYENYLLGRKRAIWLSVSNDLKHDAHRDLKDIGCHIHVNSLNKFKYDVKLSAKSMGGIKKGVIFATYSSLIGESQSVGKYNTRLKQLLHWCGSDFDGVIILDECHKAKNLVPTGSSKPTKTGLTVLTLQNSLPKARVVYCSATGASEPKNMAYMSRLGIWGIGTPFREFNEFIQAVERRGVGAMEIVAMDMKLRGMYMARQLSFAGVGFDIKDVCLSQDFIDMYDAAVKLWVDAREKFEKASDMMDAGSKFRKTMWGQFWSAHQRFFKYMCIASKVKAVVEIAERAIDLGKCIVIGLQSTGEARTLEQLEDAGGELTDFVSTAKGVIQTLVEKHFPATDKKKMADLQSFKDSYLNGSRSEVSSPVPQKKRKLNSVKKPKPPKKLKSGLERIFDLSSGSDSDSSDNAMEASKENEDSLDSIESDVNEQSSGDESDSGEDDFNPFGGFESDQEDPWLNRKAKKKSKGKSRGESPSLGDPSINTALAAAGLSVSTPIWNRPVNGLPNLSSVRTSSPTPFSMNTGSPISRIQQQNMHHSQSAPVLSSLLQKAEGSPTIGSAGDQCCAMKKELLEKIEELGKILPPNTLDDLINSLGGPENVAEMTGRKGRVVSHEDGSVSYESRSRQDVSLEFLNIEEKKRFMNGDKHIAIISEAASSGISLQADRRVQNQRRRVHITLELPWSADKAIQQFGRSHRSNQVSAPEYIFLISELAGERRFASIVAKRLESLGALTHGDRRATESRDLSRYNFDNKYGRAALETVLKSVLGHIPPMVPPPSEYKGNFFNDVRVALLGVGLVTKDDRGSYSMLDKDYTNLSRFLNRILGVTVRLQNSLFSYFMETLAAVIQQAKRNGRWDEGIVDLGSQGEEVTELSVQTFVGSKTIGTATTELHTVCVERGMSWDKAYNMSLSQIDSNEGFYLSHQVRNDKRIAIFVVSQNNKKKVYGVYRPNTGLQSKQETVQEIKKKYNKVTSSEAKPYWVSQYESSFSQCSHAYWKGNCKRQTLGLTCEVGLRRRSYNILSGSVLSVWSKVESVLAGQSGSNSKVQIIRCKRSDGGKIVGCLIPSNCVPALARTLSPHEDGQTEAIEIL